MKTSGLTCPAITQGRIGACRGCIFRAGGPSDLCIQLADAYRKNNKAQSQTVTASPKSDTSKE